MLKKSLTISLLLGVVFSVAVFVWYSPGIFKGYSPGAMTSEVMIAFNYANYGVYGYEDKMNIVVAPELVKERAVESSAGNKFGIISYSLLFKWFGWLDWNQLVLFSAIAYSLAAAIFALLVYFSFGLLAAIIFAAVYILLPFNWGNVHFLGFYEFTMIYFSLFSIFYFSVQNQKGKTNYYFLIVSGIFLALACLSREAILVFLPVLFFWLFLKKKKKQLLAVFVPLGLLLAVFWVPGMLGIKGSNDYLNLFTNKNSQAEKHSDFNYYLLAYRDPYTFHFNHQEVNQQIDRAISQKNGEFIYQISQMKGGANMGIRQVTLKERLLVGTSNLIKHLSRFFALEEIGGPLVFMAVIAGFWALKKRDPSLARFFFFWLLGVPIILSYVVLAVRSHLIDYGWVIALLAALGLISARSLLKDYYHAGKYANWLFILLIGLFVYNLILADHVYWGRAYDSDVNLAMNYLSVKIKSYPKLIAPEEVIAVGNSLMHPTMSYLTGKSVVFFHPDTIIKLVNEKNLQSAFDKFNVKYIIGYDASTTDLIIKNSQATNISSWPESKDLVRPMSYSQRWFLNLIK